MPGTFTGKADNSHFKTPYSVILDVLGSSIFNMVRFLS